MGITIQQVGDSNRLRISGDIDSVLTIPADPPEAFNCDGVDQGELIHSYYISVSDGSLIRATFGQQAAFYPIIEGAGMIDIDKDSGILRLGWSVEWINLASNCNASAVAQKSVHNLPLFMSQLGGVSAIV